MQCFIFPSKSVGIAFEAAIKRQFISSDMSHLSFSLKTWARNWICVAGEGSSAAAAGDFSAQEKRNNNEKTRMLAMFPRIGRTKSEGMEKNWRGMKLFPRVGRSGSADYDDLGAWCSDCVEGQFSALTLFSSSHSQRKYTQH
jgi:hypothetical protein